MDDSAIIMAVVVTSGSTLLAQTISPDQHPNMKPVLAGFLLGAILFAVATVSPDIAKGFAVLVSTTAVLINGAVVFPALGKVVE